MSKNKISEWSSTPANNTDVGGIDIAEGCAPSGINNAMREMMAQVKDMITGADGDSQVVGGNLSVSGTTTLTGAATAPTPLSSDNSTNIATTAFVQGKADKTITISSGAGLSGGGDLSSNRTLSIANTGVTANTYGSSSAIPVITVNAQGQVTNASTTPITSFSWNVVNVGSTVASGATGSYSIPANAILVTGTALHSMGGNTGSRVSVNVKDSGGTTLYTYDLTGGNEFNGGDGGSGMFVRSAWSVAIPSNAIGGSLEFYKSSGSNNSWTVVLNQVIKSA